MLTRTDLHNEPDAAGGAGEMAKRLRSLAAQSGELEFKLQPANWVIHKCLKLQLQGI